MPSADLERDIGAPGRSGDPLYGIRRAMLTRRSLVTPKRVERLDDVLTVAEHVAVQVTWSFDQEVIAAYDEPLARGGNKRLYKRIRSEVPKGLTKLATFGRTLWRKRAAILAYFDTGASNGAG